MTDRERYSRRASAKRLMTAGLAAVVVVSLGAIVSTQTTKTYTARLSPVPIDVTMQQTIAGSGSVTATLAGNKLTIEGTYQGLKSPATLAQIHQAQMGVRGPVFPGLDLKVSGGTSGTLTGVFTLTPLQMTNLEKSWLYVQLHSEKAPDGNLWGWLLLQENRK